MTTVHVVSHTHWDREWYLAAGRFRQRLTALVDELIDAPQPAHGSFLLYGQMAVIEDYLTVRPERAAELSALLRSGAIEAGPWYVLADELIPSGEALVRNLLAGRRTLRMLRALDQSPRVLYCPDSFGHPAALPTLAQGFGFELAIVWRGFGSTRWPHADTSTWTAPNGDHVLLYHLSQRGYELGANLAVELDASRERWAEVRGELLSRNSTGVALLLNGADHHARQANREEALASLATAATPHEIKPSSLGAFAAGLTERAAGVKKLPSVAGELRDSYGFTWTIQGTFASRAHQKRRNAQLERAMLRDVEPWIAIAARTGKDGTARRRLMEAAWRSLLLTHPHDTLCGCATDEVARAMDARQDETESQAAGLRADALNDVIGHQANAARESREAWKPMVVVRNSAARPRSGVALLRLTNFLADVPVGPGSSAVDPDIAEAAKKNPAVAEFSAVQMLSRTVAHERTEAPTHYPDNDLVLACEVAAWVPEVPAYGVRCFSHTSRNRLGEIPNPALVKGTSLSNGRISIRVHDDGRVDFKDIASGRSVSNLLRWESLVDRGDLYTPSVRGAKFVPRFAGARVVHRGPVRATIETKWEFKAKKERVSATLRLTVDADAPWLRVQVEGINAASDHRLRLFVVSDVNAAQVIADAMFGPVERLSIVASPSDLKMETPPTSAPLHRYVSLFASLQGATLFSDGLAEYEATDDGAVAVTLLRAVGELSRSDLPERPGHAGWPTPTPEAQCQGKFGAELAIMLHGPRGSTVIDSIERAADDILLPLTGGTLRSALSNPGAIRGIELQGEGLAFSSAKQSEDGGWLVLRCVNLLDQARTGTWRLGVPVVDAQLGRLDETIIQPVQFGGPSIAFVAAPHAVTTILVR